jgi:hypothetical protein
MDREKIIWAAGFYCGEGSAHISKGRTGHQINAAISIGQVNREVLDRFAEAVGVGKVRGPYGPYGRSPRQMRYYTASGRERVRAVADLLWPWLSSEKREQFESVFLALDSIPETLQRRNRQGRMSAGLDPEPPGRSPESVASSRAVYRAQRSSPEGRAKRREKYRLAKEGGPPS